MPPDVISRYQTTFRKDEIDLIIRFALRGESLGFVGIAGVGKSNVVNFLRDIQQNAPRVEQDVARLHFPIVDATQWQGSPNSLWQLMLDALLQATRDLGSPPENDKIIPISEDERTFKALQEHLEWVCQELKHQVMFVLDDFDQVLETGPLAMLERLNGLRSDGRRGYLSYLVLTKRLPHILGRAHNLEQQSKFYDLFRASIYALEPYNREDALRMLRHLNEVAGDVLTDSQLDQIYYQLAGGHARLLRLVFSIWINEGAGGGKKLTYFADKPDIQQECRRILLNLHRQEQAVALRLARGEQTAKDQAVIDHLARRGLLVKLDPPTWFSPLMAQFLAGYEEQGG
jgi:hypothetical protein